MKTGHRILPNASRGIVLFVAIVVLLILSLLGVALASSAILENRMSIGMRNLQLARIAADSAIAEARARIVSAAAVDGADRVCAQLACAQRGASASADPAEFMQAPSTRAVSIPFHLDLALLDGVDRSARLPMNPVYVVEDLGTSLAAGEDPKANPVRWFRITARAEGGTAGFTSVVEQMLAVTQE
ncbi:MAG: PilX N-terminal domain-containing pilus assembly protein [Rudaea sp.]